MDWIKNILLKVLIIILVVLGVIILIIGGGIGFRKFKEHRLLKNLSGGFEIKSEEEYKTVWENTMSDIEGMTVWDKYEMGLSTIDGADTDGDGLSDKDEIEKYNSDPLKLSTAGDLYTDSYKIDNGMDVNAFCEYKGEKVYPYNECSEVILDAQVPSDFNAVVKRQEASSGMGEVLAQYEIYNYSGKVAIDLQQILATSGKTIKDIAVYVSDGSSQKKYGFEKSNDDVITLKKELDPEYDYELYVVEKSFVNDLAIKFGASKLLTGTIADEINPEGLVSCSPILTGLFKKPIDIDYQDYYDEEKTNISKTKVVTHAQNYFDEHNSEYYSDDCTVANNALLIRAKYEVLKNAVPFFDVTYTDLDDFGILNFIYSYYSYADKVKFEAGEIERKKSTGGFDIEEDELPFENFKTDICETGNCAGFSHLTAYVFNTGGFNESGSYSNDGDSIDWNIGKDSANNTLRDRGLSDYKNSSFVKQHSSNGTHLDKSLTSGEKEFVKMIEANCLQGNYYVNKYYKNSYSGVKKSTAFDYSLIDEMKTRLESGHILDVYMRMSDGTGHAVNVYGYENDELSPDVIWFNVYDPNFPMEETGDFKLSNSGFRIKVTKRQKLYSDGYSFDYSYYPISDDSYGADSNLHKITPVFIVMDEYWNDINPAARYELLSNEFEFNYVSTGDESKDFTAICHYNDGYFADSALTGPYIPGEDFVPVDAGYNPKLATTSLCFAMSCFGSNEGGKTDYTHKYGNVKDFLMNAGFDVDNTFSYNEWFTKKPESDSIGTASAFKNITVKENGEEKGYTLIAIAVRGGGYESEWAGNFTIGNNGQHEGFATARDQVLKYLKEDVIGKNNIRGDIKIWLVGYSRAGATANLVAGALDDGYDLGKEVVLTRDNLYAYCFEPPMGALKSDIPDDSYYYNIFNIVNKNDPVPKVAMQYFNFRRYGYDIFLPAKGSDHKYESKREKMMYYYKKLDSYKSLTTKDGEQDQKYVDIDDFSMKKVNFVMLSEYASEIIGHPTLAGKISSINFVTSVNELFGNYPIEDAKAYAQMGQDVYLDELLYKVSAERIKTRENYVNTYQSTIRAVFKTINTTGEKQEKLKKSLRSKIENKDFLLQISMAKVAEEFGPFYVKKLAEETYEKAIDTAIKESLAEAEISDESGEIYKGLKKGFTELLIPLMITHPNYTATAIANRDNLGAAHYPELCLSWLMSQDTSYGGIPERISKSGNYRVVKVNCPIDVSVYDKSGEKVAYIKNDKPKDIKTSSIIAVVNEDGEKVVYLPATEEYKVHLLATGDGSMNVNVNEVSALGEIVKVQNFMDIKISKGDEYSLDVPKYDDSELGSSDSSGVDYKLVDAKEKKQESHLYSDDEVKTHLYCVEATSEDESKGYVIGAGLKIEGAFIRVSAIPEDGYHFTGWYVDNKLVSNEIEYRFPVTDDISIQARFEKGNPPLQISTIWSRYWFIVVLFIGVVVLIGLIILIIRIIKKGRENS